MFDYEELVERLREATVRWRVLELESLAFADLGQEDEVGELAELVLRMLGELYGIDGYLTVRAAIDEADAEWVHEVCFLYAMETWRKHANLRAPTLSIAEALAVEGPWHGVEP